MPEGVIDLYTHADLVGFHRALDRDRKDWTTRLVLSDWFEERGDRHTACAIRWQVLNEKYPWHCLLDDDWTWFDKEVDFRTKETAHRQLSQELLALLLNWKPQKHPVVYKEYLTLRLAEEALWRAWPRWRGARPYLARQGSRRAL